MGTILELPLWRAQRPPAVGPGQAAAQIIIFPGVRVERQDGRPRTAETESPPPRDGQASKITKP